MSDLTTRRHASDLSRGVVHVAPDEKAAATDHFIEAAKAHYGMGQWDAARAAAAIAQAIAARPQSAPTQPAGGGA